MCPWTSSRPDGRGTSSDRDGHVVRRYWELCLLWELRNALRAGNIWLENSRQYANPDSYLIPPTEWPTLREEVCGQVQVSSDGETWLRKREEELASLLTKVDRQLAGQGSVQIHKGKLSVPAIEAEALPASSLPQLVTERLPRIELSDLLIEVDRWVQFSRHFEHAGGSEPRTPDFLVHLYASIFAQACNFGLFEFARIADLSYDRLAWCTNWYIREETLRAAITSIVNYHHHLPLSQLWGGGTLSSSDGQRFPVSVRSKRAAALPRYFGYGRGLTYYTWTSDQFSQYGSKVITATVRDATYVLDEILDNETDLPIVEHTTDTAGYTELVFALFDLLGLQFSPRIRDLGDQRLYRMDRQGTYGDLEPAVKGTIRRELILKHWDDMLRLAGSSQARPGHRVALHQQAASLSTPEHPRAGAPGVRSPGQDHLHPPLRGQRSIPSADQCAAQQGRGAPRAQEVLVLRQQEPDQATGG